MLRTGGSKIQTLLILSVLVVLFLGFTGVIPEDWFLIVYLGVIGGVVVYIVASFLYPYFTLAGKHMVAVSFYKNSSEVEWAFGKVVETEGGMLFRECPGGDKSVLCAEIEPVHFVGTRVPFRLLVLKFPKKVDPYALFDSDYVEPDSGFGRIPVNIAYIGGVQIGEMRISRRTAFKSWRDRLLKVFGRDVERDEVAPVVYVTRNKVRNREVEIGLKVVLDEKKLEGRKGRRGKGVEEVEEAPIVLVTGYKTADINVLGKVSKELREIAGYQEVKGSAKAWVTELGQVRVISTELEELRADNMKLRQVIKGLEKVYQSPPTITTTTFTLEEERSDRAAAVTYAGIGAGLAVIAFLIMLILGVVSFG